MSTRDSSVVALDSDTGTILSNSMVHPKKPSRALFLEILGENQVLQHVFEIICWMILISLLIIPLFRIEHRGYG